MSEREREKCRYCGCPVADDLDWEEYGEGEGGDLCWGPGNESMGCMDAEGALDRVNEELAVVKKRFYDLACGILRNKGGDER